MALGSNVDGNINLVINAHANTAQAEKRLKAMGRGMASIQAQVESVNAKVSTAGINDKRAFADAQQNAQRLRNNYRQIAEASGQYLTVQKTITAQTTDFNKQLSRQKIGYSDVVGQMGKVRAAMREQMALNKMVAMQYSRDATGKISADIFVPPASSIKLTENLRTQLGYYNKVLHSVSEQTVNWGKNTQWAGRQLTVGFSVPLSIAAGMLSKFAIEADRGLTRIAKVYGDTEDAFQTTNESIRNMAQETALYIADQYGLAAESTRDVMGELAATGLEGKELQGMTVQVQRASLLGEMSSEDSLKLLRVMKEVYGFTSTEMAKQVNYFNAIENATALTMQDITEGLPRISGIMQATGVSIQDQTELLVAFKAAGIDVAEGANALKSINFKAVAASPTAAKNFFRITGVEMEALVEKTNGEFLPMMKEIANVMDDLESSEQVELVARIFGIHQGSRAITLLRQLADGSEGMLRATEIGLQSSEQHAKSAADEIETIQNSLAVRYDRLVQTVRATLEELGLPVLDMLLTVGQGVGKALEWINKLPDAAKVIGAWAGLGLAITGPLVMLTGLVANLVGMGGRILAFAVSLVAPFKVLEPAAKAAELIQEKFGTTLARNEAHVKGLTGGVDGLTAAITRMVNATEAANNTRLQEAGLVPEQFVAPGSTMAEYAAVGGTPQQLRTRNMPRDIHGRFVKRRPSFGPMPKPTYLGPEPWKPPTGADYAKAYKAAGSLNSVIERGNLSLEEANKKILNMGRGMTAASGAAMGLGMIFEKQWLTNISMVVMAISSMGPAMNMAVGALAKFNLNALNGTSKLTGKVSTVMAGAVSGFTKFAATAFSVLSGGVGLLLAGAVALGIAAWKRYDKKIEETKKMHEQLGASGVEALANIYDFTPTTALEKAQAGGLPGGEDSFVAQEARIKKMKDEQVDYYNALILKSKQIQDNYDAEEAKRAMVTEAIRQGARVLQQTGDEELAKRTAWDMYNAMSEEWVTFEDFKVRVSLDEKSVEETLNSVRAYLNTVNSEDIFQDFKLVPRFNGQFKLRKDDREAMKQSVQEALEYASELSPQQTKEFVERAFGEQGTAISVLVKEAIEAGFVDADVTGSEMIADWDRISSDMQLFGGRNTEWAKMSVIELAELKAQMEVIGEVNSRLVNDMVQRGAMWSNSFSGVSSEYSKYLNQQELDALNQQKLQAITEHGANSDAVNKIQAQIDALIDRSHRMAALTTGSEYMDKWLGAADALRSYANEMGVATDETDALTDSTEELDDALSKLEQRRYDAHRSSMEGAQDDLVDIYVRQFDKLQDAERAAQDDYAASLIEDIEDEYDGLESIMEADHKGRMKTLDNAHKMQSKALDAEKKAADKALRKAQDAEKKALDARVKANREAQKAANEALKDRFEILGDELEKRQETRRKGIENAYDAQIEKIEKQIETEERLEKQRQEMYERERERLQRMAGLFDSNIDLNMAINSGDLDEAARIANDMRTRQAEWATQDLSRISGDASETRREGMKKKIDSLEERKNAELERIKEVEEAEKKALEEREERERAALEAKFERIEAEIEAEKEKLAELHELQREALSEDFALRSEKLSERQAKEKETLNQTTADEKAALAERRSNAITAQEATNADNRAALDERLADAKAMFDQSAQYWREMVAADKTAFVKGNKDMAEYFREKHNPAIEDADAASLEVIWDHRDETYKQKFRTMANDDMWEMNARRIAKSVLKGIIGEDMSISEIQKFVLEGMLPKRMRSKTGVNDVNRMGAVPRHSGGIIGNPADDSWTGPGFYSKSQEVDIRALKGEGVLNLNAMRQPGVPELMYALNSGRKIDQANRARPANMRQKGDGPGFIGGALGGIAGLVRRATEAASVTAAEHGYGRMMERIGFSSTDIAYDGSAGPMSTEQLKNAGYIISTGRRLGATDRDIMTALMTAMQESSLINVNYGDDIHGVRNPDGSLTSSLGLFQQQRWWGSVEDRMNPSKSAEIFYRALFDIDNRNSMPMWQAAQAVQRSAYPRAYARWEGLAAALLGGAQGSYTVSHASDVEPGMTWPAIWQLVKSIAPEARMTSNYREGARTRGYGNLSYHGKGQAIDIVSPDMMKTYNKLIGVLPWNEAIYTPAGNRQMRNGRFYREMNPITMMDHWDHIHLAYDGMLSSFKPIMTDASLSLEERASALRDAIKQIRDSGIGFNAGGLVPGTGSSDSVNAKLTPGEFVMRKHATRGNVDLFKAINNGEIDLNSVASKVAGNIDNGGGARYDVNIEFSGPVNSEIDFEKVVRRTITDINRNKPQNRRIN